jgi:uncharacterized protein YbjT (DUF2867 family)
MLNIKDIILVTGATSSQGGAVTAALLKRGNNVRVIVRESSLESTAAKILANAGAEVVIADIEDQISLQKAVQGVYGVFSVQAMDNGSDSERRHADMLLNVALQAGVQHIVHVSVSQLGNFKSFPGWGENRWNEKYWTDKEYAESAVKQAGFKYWTVLRPTFFMDNFILPKVNFMYPGLENGKITVVFNPDKKLQFIDVKDTGEFAAAAFNDPEKFNHQIIELAGDKITIGEIADLIGKTTGIKIDLEHLTETQAVNKGMVWPLANYQEWTNVVGYNVDIKALKNYGIPLTSFENFFVRNRNLLPL